MPRRPARASGRLVFHVLNRAVQNTVIFLTAEEYADFLALVRQAAERFAVRILAYAVMPNHWHLVVWPLSDNGLSAFMHWLTGRHAQLWREKRGTHGRGAVYQGRFRAIAVQCDGHFIRLCRYVERNPLRARLVDRSEDWPWSSASPSASEPDRPALCEWPVRKPGNWREYLNEPDCDPFLKEVRSAIRRNQHLGDASWRESTLQRLGWRSGRGPGRPRRANPGDVSDNSVIDFSV